jgi:hypothetical protein
MEELLVLAGDKSAFVGQAVQLGAQHQSVAVEDLLKGFYLLGRDLLPVAAQGLELVD